MQDIPQPFLEKMAILLGEEFDEFVFSLNQVPVSGLRVNTLKISSEEFRTKSPFHLTKVSWCESGFLIESKYPGQNEFSPGKHPYHDAGLYYLQEPSAMFAAQVLSPLPGEKVLDIAAAPGGKSTHLAALMQNTGLLIANEIHPKRVWDLAENIERCGVTNAIVMNEPPQRIADYFGEYFDRVLLDAPCSGEGMFRKSDLARREWNIELPKGCSLRQLNILDQAARLTKSGGRIVYTTCTFSPEENEWVIAKFLDGHTEFDIESIKVQPGQNTGRPEWISYPPGHKLIQAIRFWPHRSQSEGHFCVSLVKNHYKHTSNRSLQISNLVNTGSSFALKERKQSSKIVQDFFEEYFYNNLEETNILLRGNYIYQIPSNSPKIIGLNVIHPGWWLGTILQDRFIPSHALAKGISSDRCKFVYNMEYVDPRLSTYLQGESIISEGEEGWIIITVDGFTLGWGKRVKGVIKNHYPHGLRHYKT